MSLLRKRLFDLDLWNPFGMHRKSKSSSKVRSSRSWLAFAGPGGAPPDRYSVYGPSLKLPLPLPLPYQTLGPVTRGGGAVRM